MRAPIFYLSVLAACGGTTAIPDAILPPDALPQPITVTITAAGIPRAGVHVVVTGFDGRDGGTFDTDATGVARPIVALDDTITAVNPFPEAGTNFYTVANPAPGDAIEMRAPRADTGATTMAVTLPVFAGATHYGVDTACGSGAADAVALAGCGPTTPLLALALDDADQLLASIWVDAAPVGPTLDLGAAPYSAAQHQVYALHDIPATATVAGVAYLVVTDAGTVYANRGSATPAQGDATLSIAELGAIGTAARAIVDASYVASSGTIHHAIGSFTSFDFATRLTELSAPMVKDGSVQWLETVDDSGTVGLGGPGGSQAAIVTLQRDDGTTRHIVSAYGSGLDFEGSAFQLQPIAGIDLSGTWSVRRLAIANTHDGDRALVDTAFTGDAAFATISTPSLVSEYVAP